MHTPVLLQETIEALDIHPGGKYVDGTYGLGGHAKEIAKNGGEVLGIDLDEENVINRTKEIEGLGIKIVYGNFADTEKIAIREGFEHVDGVLFDLGISMEQISASGRGFSYKRREEPLDMRISTKNRNFAADIVNSYSIERLYEVFAKGSEELASSRIAHYIERSRSVKKIETVGDFVSIIEKMGFQKKQEEGVLRRIFQALRIEVNNEFENLKSGLLGAKKVLKPDGRIAVITFHPGEDRIVKKFAREHDMKFLTKKAVRSRGNELFERSAKLRILMSK